MLQESKHVTKHCDGCGNRVEDRNPLLCTTDFKPTYIEKGDLHICPACSFAIMHKHLVKDISTTELKELLKDTHPFSSPFVMSFTGDLLGDISSMTLASCSGADDMSTGTINLHNLNVKA